MSFLENGLWKSSSAIRNLLTGDARAEPVDNGLERRLILIVNGNRLDQALLPIWILSDTHLGRTQDIIPGVQR